jgi:hypothetical protein
MGPVVFAVHSTLRKCRPSRAAATKFATATTPSWDAMRVRTSPHATAALLCHLFAHAAAPAALMSLCSTDCQLSSPCHRLRDAHSRDGFRSHVSHDFTAFVCSPCGGLPAVGCRQGGGALPPRHRQGRPGSLHVGRLLPPALRHISCATLKTAETAKDLQRICLNLAVLGARGALARAAAASATSLSPGITSALRPTLGCDCSRRRSAEDIGSSAPEI